MVVCENLTKEGLDMDLGMILFIIGIILVIVGFITFYIVADTEKLAFIYFSLVIMAAGVFCIVQALISFQVIII